MKTENEIIDILYKKYQSQGYISEQDIFDLCDGNSLSFIQTDRVCNRLFDLGVLISDGIHPDNDNSNEDVIDYSQFDYSEVYSFFLQNYPQMKTIVEYIKSTNPPQKGEANNLVIQMRSGNAYARKILVEKYLRVALRITMNYKNKTYISLEDVFSVACDGLVTAIDSYDPCFNSAFSSFISLWIMRKIERYIQEHEFYYNLPIHLFTEIIDILNCMNGCDSFAELPKDCWSLTIKPVLSVSDARRLLGGAISFHEQKDSSI